MAIAPGEMRDVAGARRLIARAADADLRDHRMLTGAIEDLFLPEEARLDDRMRAAVGQTVAELVDTVEAELRHHVARLLAGRGQPALAEQLMQAEATTLERLARSGVLRDGEFMREMIGRTRQNLFTTMLPIAALDDAARPSLLVQLLNQPDRAVAGAALALMNADSLSASQVGSGLSAELHHRLVWWVAAALRDEVARPVAALDRALGDAAQRSLGAYDEGERPEAIALRLAAALDRQGEELAALLGQALDDRRLGLFIAALAHALGIDFSLARELVLDPTSDRLALSLRALDLPTSAIVTFLLALAAADPRRDEAEVETQGIAVGTISPTAAREAILPLTLHPDFRTAMLALARGR